MDSNLNDSTQLMLIRSVLINRMGVIPPGHISTYELFQRYLDQLEDEQEGGIHGR